MYKFNKIVMILLETLYEFAARYHRDGHGSTQLNQMHTVWLLIMPFLSKRHDICLVKMCTRPTSSMLYVNTAVSYCSLTIIGPMITCLLRQMLAKTSDPIKPMKKSEKVRLNPTQPNVSKPNPIVGQTLISLCDIAPVI